MSGYAFSSAEIAQFLKDYANANLAGLGGGEAPLGREVITVKAPATAIPAIDGTTISEGDCTRAYISDLEIAESASITLPVLNMSGEDIAADTYFQAARIGSDWVALSGGGAGGKDVCQITATSEITAASGTLLGTGSGSKLEISSDGSQLQSAGATVDIRNPWEESIESGSMMTCYSDGSYYVVIQASCPTEAPPPETP